MALSEFSALADRATGAKDNAAAPEQEAKTEARNSNWAAKDAEWPIDYAYYAYLAVEDAESAVLDTATLAQTEAGEVRG
jgi:hypothetical protein